MNIRKLNNKAEPLTIEEIKEVKGYENLSDEEAIQVIHTLERFTAITYYLFKNQEQNENEEFEYRQAA